MARSLALAGVAADSTQYTLTRQVTRLNPDRIGSPAWPQHADLASAGRLVEVAGWRNATSNLGKIAHKELLK